RVGNRLAAVLADPERGPVRERAVVRLLPVLQQTIPRQRDGPRARAAFGRLAGRDGCLFVAHGRLTNDQVSVSVSPAGPGNARSRRGSFFSGRPGTGSRRPPVNGFRPTC